VKVRKLGLIQQLPADRQLETLSRGLELLVGNVTALMVSLAKLSDPDTQRGWRVLKQLCEEESAKCLILLDYLRIPRGRAADRSRHLKYFYDHFVRCLYAEYCWIRPSTMENALGWVEQQRPSLYLDGPNDVDWIFRNDMIQHREQAMYVDYVEMDSTPQWIGPEQIEVAGLEEWQIPSRIIELVLCMHRLRLFDAANLATIEKEWALESLDPSVEWKHVEAKNRNVLRAAASLIPNPTKKEMECAQIVADEWLFPLGGIELSQRTVDEEELRRRQAEYGIGEAL